MTMRIMTLVAETPIHVGIGQAAEAIDLPVAREGVTRFPHVPGSGVKGAWRVWAEDHSLDVKTLFGLASGTDEAEGGAAGQILFGEARLLLLPVRCTSDSHKLVTCPLILNRLKRDLERCGHTVNWSVPVVQLSQFLGSAPDHLGLEEREFSKAGDLTKAGDTNGIVETLKAFAVPLADMLAAKLVVISDADFGWMAEYSLPVAMRNHLNEDKIVVDGALWAEETLPSDCVLWSVTGERKPDAISTLETAMNGTAYIQMGGKETIGQGWFSARMLAKGATR